MSALGAIFDPPPPQVRWVSPAARIREAMDLLDDAITRNAEHQRSLNRTPYAARVSTDEYVGLLLRIADALRKDADDA